MSTSPEESEPELGAGSLWLLRVGSAVVMVILVWFLVDAIIG